MRIGCYTEVLISLRALAAYKKAPRLAELKLIV